MVKSGIKAQTMMAVEKEQRSFDFVAGMDNPFLERQVGILAGADMAINVLHHDDRRIDNDAEIHRANRQQVCRLSSLKNSRENANSKASGILIATISALRTLLRNMSRITVTSPMPTSMFFTHGFRWSCQSARCDRSKARSARRAASRPGLLSLATFSSTSLSAGSEYSPLRKQHDALHLFLFVDPHRLAVRRR